MVREHEGTAPQLPANHTSVQEYYETFEGGARAPSKELRRPYLLKELLQVVEGQEQATLMKLGENERLTTVVLGSAAAENINQVSEFFETIRPSRGATPQDRIVIIDIIDQTLQRHQATIKRKIRMGRKDIEGFSVVKMDMRQLGITDRSINIMLSDCTLNFLSTKEECAIAFSEMSRTLHNDGVIYLRFIGDPRASTDPQRLDDEHGNALSEPQANPFIRLALGGRMSTYHYPFSVYSKLAKQNGLTFTLLMDYKQFENGQVHPQSAYADLSSSERYREDHYIVKAQHSNTIDPNRDL